MKPLLSHPSLWVLDSKLQKNWMRIKGLWVHFQFLHSYSLLSCPLFFSSLLLRFIASELLRHKKKKILTTLGNRAHKAIWGNHLSFVITGHCSVSLKTKDSDTVPQPHVITQGHKEKGSSLPCVNITWHLWAGYCSGLSAPCCGQSHPEEWEEILGRGEEAARRP